MNCCVNKTAWCFSTEGLITVGQDEIVYLLECMDNEKTVPKDIFLHINNIYNDAVRGEFSLNIIQLLINFTEYKMTRKVQP